MKRYIFVVLALIALMSVSCRKEYPEVYNPVEQSNFESWSDIFESYWNAMNYSYVFWDVDPTDWDKVYADYKPQFDELEFGVAEDSARVMELFTEVTSGLIDHHYTLSLKNPDGSVLARFTPRIEEMSSRDYYHAVLTPDVLYNVCVTGVESGRYTQAVSALYSSSNMGQLLIYTLLIEESIVYLRFNVFAIFEAMSCKDEKVEKVIDTYLSLIEDTPDLKGIIIDTRSNTGGYLLDVELFLKPLLTEPLLFGYSHTKAGMGRLDYTPWTPWQISPMPQEDRPVKRDLSNVAIVSLVDLHSISMAEMTAMAVSAMPNGTVIGERTAGGQGPLNNNYEMYYAGTVDNEAYEMYTTTSASIHLDGKCYEGIGVIPDIETLYDDEEFLKGNDTQLERAIEFIKTGK